MKLANVAFKAQSLRRRPIPGHPSASSYSMFVLAEDIPEDFPAENVRSTTDTNRQVYRDVRETLLNEDGQPNSFIFKNLGIRVIADHLEHDEKTGIVKLKNAGTANGAHTLAVVKQARELLVSANEAAVAEGNPRSMLAAIDVRVDVGVPADWITDIVQANNNTVAVRKLAFAEHKDFFAWLKDAMPEKIVERIDFRDEGAVGTWINATDLLCFLSVFHIGNHPNLKEGHPISGYASANQIVKQFTDECEKQRRPEDGQEGWGAKASARTSWAKLAPIAHDILMLRDIIGSEARGKYQRPGTKFGKLSFVVYTDAERKTPSGRPAKKKDPIKYHFLGKTSEYGLMRGALFPMLAAFRALVVEGEDGKYRWVQDFAYVKDIWDTLGRSMMDVYKAATNNGQTSSDTVAKNPNTWDLLHKAVLIEHMRRTADKG